MLGVQARDRRDKSECDSAEHRVAIWSFSIFLIPKMPQNTKIFIWQPRWNMISPVIFDGALMIFAGAFPPWSPPW